MTREASQNATYPQKIAALILIAHENDHPFICGICGKPILPGQRINFDHTHAVGRGGQNRVEDLRPVHDIKGDPDFDCHMTKTSHPRGPHTAIGGDTFEAAKTPRLADKLKVEKRPIDTILDDPEERCRRCGQDPCQCRSSRQKAAFGRGR